MPNRASGVMWDRLVEEAAPGARARGGLSLQAIVDTAIAIADVDGLDAVSIRRVAAVLEVRPMSLYTHIASKDELLALMADELIGTLLVEQPLPDDWREALTVHARKMFLMCVSHPWLLALFTRRPRPGPNAARQAKQAARALEGLPLPAEERWKVLGIVNDYVIGNALRVATTGTARDLVEALTAADRAARPELDALTAFEDSRLADETFGLGLRVVLDGVERRFLSGPR
ncbi:MAG: TetR/AcrR family transcriptional regulator C-terminal domain-containing protein [Actinobacteria bacterium]|nr:TetR/AcrR family transcriptional regulator C-terminal domain-containing protein [Actinomycetota bacterium]